MNKSRFRFWILIFFCGRASLFASADLYTQRDSKVEIWQGWRQGSACEYTGAMRTESNSGMQTKPKLTFESQCIYKNFQAIIFDCDGILVDTEYLKFLAWQEALASQAIEFSVEEYMPLVGHSSKNILQMIQYAKKIEISEEIIGLKNARYKMLQKRGVPAIQAMVDFVRHLSANKPRLGVVLGLASSAPKAEILTNLQQIGLENAFDLIISGSDDLDDYADAEGKNKPKPYIYIEASKRLNILPKSCLVFEDTAAGIDAAADAGMVPIAVPNQFTLNHDFSKALRVFSSQDELPSIEVFQR